MNKSKEQNLLIVLFLISALCVQSQNPIFRGFADAHMKVWNGKMYISAGKDKAPDNNVFDMPYWSVFSSNDMVNWTLESKIEPKDTYLGLNFLGFWATDITTRNGKYYFYFSNHNEATGVLVADKPDGPYSDVLKKPLISKDYSVNHEYDPTIFVDDDGEQYIIFGRDGKMGNKIIHYQIAKLNKDMVSLSEKSRDLINSRPLGFGSMKVVTLNGKKDTIHIAQDHQYFHKYKGIYYLSCAGAYETSTNVYGPFSNRRHTGQNGHSSFTEYNGQTYHCYEWTCQPFGNRMYRQVNLTYLHYKDNGDMVSDSVFLQESNVAKQGKYYANGVGNYDAKWAKIEAEWFFKKSGKLLKKECAEGGFELQNIRNNDVLMFQYVRNINANTTINIRISAISKSASTIEIREDSEQGTLIGTCSILPATGVKAYQTISCKLTNKIQRGNTNLYFVFKGGEGELMRLNWFNFTK